MSKKYSAFAKKNWVTISDRKAFADAEASGRPIMLTFPNGSYRVIKNAENLPEGFAVGYSVDRAKAAKQKEKAAG